MKLPAAKVQFVYFRVVLDLNAQLFRRAVIAVEQSLPAAEKKRICARQMQSAAERWLEASATSPHPCPALSSLSDHGASQYLVRMSAGYFEQVVPILILRI